MSTEHTPGPWRIRAERYRYIRIETPLGGIAHLDTIDAEGAANARLIAASPKLLDLVKIAISKLKTEHQHSESTMHEWAVEARAVIASVERVKA